MNAAEVQHGRARTSACRRRSARDGNAPVRPRHRLRCADRCRRRRRSRAPAAYLIDDWRRSVRERVESRQRTSNQLETLTRGAGQARRAFARHHPAPLAGRRRQGDAAGAGRRVRRFRRAHPPDRSERDEEDAGAVRHGLRCVSSGPDPRTVSTATAARETGPLASCLRWRQDRREASAGRALRRPLRRIGCGSAVIAADNARMPLVRAVRPCPVQHHHQPIAKADQKVDVRQQPHRPCRRNRTVAACRIAPPQPSGQWWRPPQPSLR